MLTKPFYKHLELGLSSQNCLYFQGFWGPKLLNGCLVLWPTQRALHVESTSIPRGFDEFPRDFHGVFFDVISLIEKSTLFPRTFFAVISMVEKYTLFPHTFFDVISMVKKSTLLPRAFFDVISLVEISTMFLLTFFDLILMVEKSTFLHIIFLTKFR